MFNSNRFFENKDADLAKAYLGKTGWFSCGRMEDNSSMGYGRLTCSSQKGDNPAFGYDNGLPLWSVFYPEEEETMKEWASRVGFKDGDKVLVARKPIDCIYWLECMDVLVGNTYVGTVNTSTSIKLDGKYSVPYSCLEVVAPQTYVQFECADEIFNEDMGLKVCDKSGNRCNWCIFPILDIKCRPIILIYDSIRGEFLKKDCTEMFEEYTYNGHPFGRKVN